MNEMQAMSLSQKIAIVCHEANRGYCRSINDLSQTTWEDAPQWQKDSAILGVEFRLNNPTATPESMHKSWMEQKTKDGWIYGTVKNPEKKEHPCMVPYSDLPPHQRKKDEIFSAIVDVLK